MKPVIQSMDFKIEDLLPAEHEVEDEWSNFGKRVPTHTTPNDNSSMDHELLTQDSETKAVMVTSCADSYASGENCHLLSGRDVSLECPGQLSNETIDAVQSTTTCLYEEMTKEVVDVSNNIVVEHRVGNYQNVSDKQGAGIDQKLSDKATTVNDLFSPKNKEIQVMLEIPDEDEEWAKLARAKKGRNRPSSDNTQTNKAIDVCSQRNIFSSPTVSFSDSVNKSPTRIDTTSIGRSADNPRVNQSIENPRSSSTPNINSPGFNVDADDLQTYLFSTDIKSIQFLELWAYVLEKTLKWKWLGGMYVVPDPQENDLFGNALAKGERFHSAKQAMDFMAGDEYTLSLFQHLYIDALKWYREYSKAVKYNDRHRFQTTIDIAKYRSNRLRQEVLSAYYPVLKRIEYDTRKREEDRKKKQVSHQRDTRPTYGFGGNDVICDVCFCPENDRAHQGVNFRPFVKCRSCKLTVHFDCYLPTFDEEHLLGAGYFSPLCGVDHKGFFKCFVCSFNPAKGRNRQAAKDENFASSKSIEAHGDGRLHSSEKFCQLCLRNDVCGGLKTLDDAGTRAVYVHQTCMLSVNEAYNKGDKIAFICGKKDKSIHYCPTVKLNRMLIDSISKVSYI